MTKGIVKSGSVEVLDLLETVETLERQFSEIRKQVIRKESLSTEDVQALIEHRNPFETPGWIRKRTKELQQRLKDFFGKEYDLSPFQETLKRYGRERIEAWEALDLKVTYLPPEQMNRNDRFPGWEIEPNDWFYDQLKKGNIFRRNSEEELVKDRKADGLEGIVVLFDSRCKPIYRDGEQMWRSDENLLGSLIAKLRKQEKIQKYIYGPQNSRFGISANEWQEQLRPAVAKLLGLEVEQIRLERTIEFNVLSQLYADLPRGQDGRTDTWVWFEEFSEDASRRLNGGHSGVGGLAYVDWDYSDRHWDHTSVRPLVVLAA